MVQKAGLFVNPTVAFPLLFAQGCPGCCILQTLLLCRKTFLGKANFVKFLKLLPCDGLFLCLEFYTSEGGEINMAFGGLRGRGVKKQDPPIERDLYLSLEDLFYGCTKKIKISRRVSQEVPCGAGVASQP